MELKTGQELYDAGMAGRHELNLDLDPAEALALRIASQRSEACTLRTDSVGRALRQIEAGGETASLAEAYDGQLSHSVLARIIEARAQPPIAEAAA